MTKLDHLNSEPEPYTAGQWSEKHQSGDLIHRLIESQQQLTAVERFSQRHESITSPSLQPHYRDLIPLEAPGVDEQYSFEVDLDACSGCKACVAACHSLNGLEEGELWRNVGLLVGGADQQPVAQHVTAACHHCLEPACMHGCPVNAYEKDPLTGIVEHLDDQCIGCKYCMFMCPYDVPSYSKSKGIVRKCNMCIDRLAVGEAPACVQACPSQAIKITKVKRDVIVDNSETDQLVPGAPDVHLTMPTTRYTTKRVLPRNLLPSDYYIAKPLHAHFPLVFMLTLTQMAFGIFATGFAISQAWPSVASELLNRLDAIAFVVLVLGLSVAILHLGRPLRAYRAMAGMRTSWLSREIAGFNLFAATATALMVWGWFSQPVAWTGISRSVFAGATALTGAIAIACSAMLYIVTKRPLWTGFRTTSLFFLTAGILGTATSLLAIDWLTSGTMLANWIVGDLVGVRHETLSTLAPALCVTIGLLVAVKLMIEASVFAHLKSFQFTPHRHAANLMVGDMRWPTVIRFALAIVGGLIVPGLYWSTSSSRGLTALAAVGLTMLLFAELIERYLFFAISVARRMPGAPN